MIFCTARSERCSVASMRRSPHVRADRTEDASPVPRVFQNRLY
jgi:hypothetical protein